MTNAFLPTALLALACLLAPAVRAEDDLHELKIGDAAPDFSLPGIDGKTHALAEYQSAKVLMIAFLSNHCPDVHAVEKRILALVDATKDQGFTLVAINPNNPDGLSIDELGYSKYNDNFADMKKYAAEVGFHFPYLYDGETQAVAKAYGCQATPHVFVFDAQRKLRYKGQFDDSRFRDPATVKSNDARKAVEALLAGAPVPVEVTRPHGCSTKWIGKKVAIAQLNEKWAHTPVDVEPITTAQVAALVKNGSGRLRLINVWSTTCVPCVAEFPELVTTARKFDMRDFEFISISLDAPEDTAKAKAFLEKQGAGALDNAQRAFKAQGRTTNSYLFAGADANELVAALDPAWPGAMPHTVLVDDKGTVIWRHTGIIDGEELRSKIIDVLGDVFTR